MAVSMRAKLVGLLDYVEKQGIVAVRAIGKKPIGHGRSMWQFSVKGKGERVPRQTPAMSGAAASGSQSSPQGEPWDDLK